MNVMTQHDRARPGCFDDAIANHGRAGTLPIQRIDVPEYDLVAELIVDPTFFSRRKRSVGRPHQSWLGSNRAADCIIGFSQFATHAVVGHFAKVRMRPTMVSNFVTLVRRTCNDVGMFRDVFTDHKESRFDMMSCEQIEQFRSELWAG